MEIVQSSSEAMSIINCNDEAKSYLANIPSEYQEVEYIQSSGGQLIKTGVVLSATGYKSVIDFQITSTSVSDQAIIGDYFDGYSSGHYRCGYGQNDGFTMTGGVSTTVRQTATGTTSLAVSSYQIYLFAKQRFSDGRYDSNAYAKFYSCKIYNPSNELIRNFYACYRKSDNVVGLYDKVNGVFYTNQGSGSFTKGPNYKRTD